MKFRGLLALACAVALTAGCNGNRSSNTIANDTGSTGTAGSGVSALDKNWVNDQLADGMAEVELARLAKDHAGSADVKQFADMMIADHSKAGDQLKQIASTYAIPQDDATIDSKHQNLIDKLGKLRGAEFDKEYMSAMVDDHEDAVSDLRRRVSDNRSLGDRITGKETEKTAPTPEKADNHADAALNQWAANTLPTVEQHLDRAKALNDALKNTGRTERGTSGKTNTDTSKGASKY